MRETMENLIREVKYAGRSLARSKGFAATVMVTLSACIAVNVAIFAIVSSVLLRHCPSRTPLTLMLSPLEDLLARGDLQDGTAWEELQLMHRNGLKLLKLVNTLLD